MAKKTYILDTNVYLTDSNSIFSFGNNDIVVPIKVLEEIDKHKKRHDGVGDLAEHGIERVAFAVPSAPRDEVLPLLDRYAEVMSSF